ncbi:hypothetical protein L345_14843, partial [Ophiophagus hannah]
MPEHSCREFESELATQPRSKKFRTFFAKSGLHCKSKDQLTKVFEVIDQDKSGYIEKGELKVLTDKETTEFLEAGDTDGDGKIGVEEFVVLVTKC